MRQIHYLPLSRYLSVAVFYKQVIYSVFAVECAMKEVEVKLRSSKKEQKQLEKKLKVAGWKMSGKRKEINQLYVHPAMTLKENGETLRLRKSDKTTLTFKGPRELNKHGLKVRKEYEVVVSDPRAMESILGKLGFAVNLTVKKTRISYRKGKTEIALDSVHGLGDFIEIEGPEKEILSLLEKLGLEDRERLTQGYAELLLEKDV